MILTFLLFAFAFKEKIVHLLIAGLFGLLAVLPISLIQYYIPELSLLSRTPILYSLLKSLFLYGLIEEAIKMALLWPLPHKNYTAFDFLLISFFFGITLGCFESVVYFFDHLQIANARGASLIYSQIFTRIFTSDIIHLTCTGLAGLFVYSCRQHNSKLSFLITAILLHGIYDFFAGFQNGFHWFSIVVVLLAIAECRIKYVSLQNNVE